VAVPGLKVDGHNFIPQALDNGAVAVVIQKDRPWWLEFAQKNQIPAILVEDARAALSRLAASFYGFPGRNLRVIGVTGTDGKTSLVHLVAHILRAWGAKVGIISTVGTDLGTELSISEGRTTPEAPELQAALAAMVANGCQYAVLECTSHGLTLKRVEDAYFDVAVLTQLREDHLDFHGSWEEYRAAKGRLFSLLDQDPPRGGHKWAVVNADDPSSPYFLSLTRAHTLTYGLAPEAQVRAFDVEEKGWGIRFRLSSPWGEGTIEAQRPGEAGLMGALAGASAALALGVPMEVAVRAIASWPGAPGRLELVDEGQPFRVVVDFAHAPDALARLLRAVRPLSQGRVIVVFGCIGGRDRERRRPMGRIAGQLADFTIITDDNPYDEDRDSILGEIEAGLKEVGRKVHNEYAVVPHRRQAIECALDLAQPGDVVVLAGKGHESHVWAGPHSYPCNDAEVARAILRQRYGR